MANKEQLNILKQGVEMWNQWRQEHPQEIPDLRAINLNDADLSNADLSTADLGSVFFIGATLKRVDFTGADLTEANLQRGDLREAKFQGADLTKANFREADLKRATLDFANLTEADLTEANLYDARLVRADFSKANITGALLYGTARDDWIIDGIICEYVFWDDSGEIRTPKNRDFRPGEFEELYKYLPTVEYYFEHGFTPIDAVVMDRVVQVINEQHPEFELKLDSFHSRGQAHAVFTVLHKDNVEEVRKAVTSEYETRLKVLEGQKEQLMQVIAMLGSGGITIQSAEGGVNIRQITAGRDYHERIDGQAQVHTGASGTDTDRKSGTSRRRETS